MVKVQNRFWNDTRLRYNSLQVEFNKKKKSYHSVPKAGGVCVWVGCGGGGGGVLFSGCIMFGMNGNNYRRRDGVSEQPQFLFVGPCVNFVQGLFSKKSTHRYE